MTDLVISLYDYPRIGLDQAVMAISAPTAATRAGTPGFEDLLVAVGRSRNKDAFIRLFEHYAPRIKSFLMKDGTAEAVADELAQETMLTVWQRAESYDPAKSGAGTWIYTIARNKRIDAARRQTARGGRSPTVPVDMLYAVPDDDAIAPDDALARAQDSDVIGAALAALPPEQADMLARSYFDGKSHSEIAHETGLPIGTVKSRIRLALERLRGHIGTEHKP